MDEKKPKIAYTLTTLDGGDTQLFASYAELKEFVDKSEGGVVPETPKKPVIPQDKFLEWLEFQEALGWGVKQPTKKEPENPDCAPATKGWVKHTLRDIYQHHHYPVDNTSSACAVIGAIVAVFVLVTFSNSWFPIVVSTQWFAPVVMFLCICLVLIGDRLLMDNEPTGTTTAFYPRDLKCIQKWEPPECKDKRECE